MPMRPCPPVVIDSLLDDTAVVERILERQSPHPTTLAGAEFVETRRQLEAAAAAEGPIPAWLQVDDRGRPVLAGVFRTTWADGDERVDEAEVIADHPGLAEAARRVFDAEIVRPYFVYANISTPKRRDIAHTDITAFRGIDRRHHPTWLLNAMNHSGLFTRWRVHIATAVAWFYDGIGGGFSYWPDGREGDATAFDAPRNSCIVGDNDVMFHRVEQIGDGAEPTFGFDAAITLTDGHWEVDDDGAVTRFDRDEVRVSVSWKAMVFADATAARIFDDHTDDLDLHTIDTVFGRALADRGVEVEGSVLDSEFGAAVRAAYLPAGV